MITRDSHAITMRGELQRARDVADAVRTLGSKSTQPLVPSLGRAVTALDEAIQTLTDEIGDPLPPNETAEVIDEGVAVA